MNCPYEKERIPLIDRYIRGELTGAEKERFEEHYFGCDDCFDALRETRMLAETIRKNGKKIFPESPSLRLTRDSNRGSFFTGWKIFAAAALIAGGLIYLIFSFTDRSDIIDYHRITLDDTAKTKRDNDELRKTGGADTTTKNINQMKNNRWLADAFTPSPQIENFINHPFRSNTITEWLSPPDSCKNPDRLLFQWKATQDENLSLKLLNNKEQIVYHAPMNNGFTLILRDLRLKPGLYYWKVETETDLIRVGKFIIK